MPVRAQEQLEPELAPHRLVGDRVAGQRRERASISIGDRLVTGEVALGVDDLLGRSRRPRERGIDRAPRLAPAQRRDERTAPRGTETSCASRIASGALSSQSPLPGAVIAFSIASATSGFDHGGATIPTRDSITSIISAMPSPSTSARRASRRITLVVGHILERVRSNA